MNRILTQPLFLIGLVIRLGMILLLLPKATNLWYAPFMDITTAQFTIDPWDTYLKHAGALVAAFPYGYLMWLAFLPLTLLCKLAGISVAYGYGITLVAADLSLLIVLNKMLPNREHLLLAIYWLSPIVLLSTYWLGLNDLIPVLLLSLALYFTKQLRLLLAGLFCAAAISAKFSMVLTVPFFLIYLTHNKALRQLLPDYLKGIIIISFALGLPFVFSTSGLHMLLHNPEMDKIYQLRLNLGNNILIYVLPLAYLVTLYFAWRVRRLNYDLFNALLGIAFLIVVLLTPASPGWFIWIMPMLVFYQATNGKIAIALTATFSALYVLNSLLITPVSPFIWIPDKGGFIVIEQLSDLSGTHIISLLHTAMVAIGIILTMRIWRETVSSNDYFKLSRKPFAIGIAGDSGAGKDTLAESLRGLFGSHSVAYLSGDDYHLWDRQKPIWQVMTHLNPRANDLESFGNDLVDLISGKSILSRHYNHQTGKMSSRQFHIKSNDFIIASGLHALYLPTLRNCYNLSIFLDINEELRRYYKLQRDVHQRGHSPERVLLSLEKREPDSARFIRSQFVHADLVMSLQPIHPHILKEVTEEKIPRVKLSVISRSGLNELSLTRVLVGVCGLHVDVNINQDTTESSMIIEGETSTEDIALAAKILFPRIFEFLDIAPQWKDGILGLMQLITLVHIDQALNRRLIG
jgi:uridine kinase